MLCTIVWSMTAYASDVTPLVKVSWGQYSPYNAHCPYVNDKPTAAGCVALALSQLMTVHQSDMPLKGEIGYVTSTHHILINEEIEGRTIDWKAIIDGTTKSDTPDGNATTAPVNTVSNYIYLCGAAVKTDYCTETTTSRLTDIMAGLSEHFGYDTDMYMPCRESYTAREWQQMIVDELQKGRPVMMSAVDRTYGAHAFVIDGMRDALTDNTTADDPQDNGNDAPLFHIKWGWEGKYDGYYLLDRLNPSQYLFDTEQRILLNCHPDDNLKTLPFWLEATARLSATTVTAGSGQVTLNLTFSNRACRLFDGSYVARLTSPEGHSVTSGKKIYIRNITSGHSLASSATLPVPTEPGVYTLSLDIYPLGIFTSSPGIVTGTVTLNVIPSTGISTPETSHTHRTDTSVDPSAPVYSITGQRLTAPRRGLNIINGRKVIIR